MKRGVVILLLVLISLTYFTTRLYKIESYPHYFNDESFYHQMSLNIRNGRFVNFNGKLYLDIYGLKYTPHEHPPLHMLITSLFVTPSIVSIRIINVVLNFIIMFLIFFILQKLINSKAGLIGALIWTCYPFAIYMNRLNFPHTSLALFALCFILAALYNRPYLSMLSIILATLSQYCGILLIIPYFIKFKFTKHSLIALASSVVVGLIYLYWALDKFVVEQFAPTFERFVLLWSILLIVGIFLVIFLVICLCILYISYDKVKPHIRNIKKLYQKRINPLLWVLLFFYLIFMYLFYKHWSIYEWYSFGINVFYIGIIGLLLVKDKTPIWSFIVLQLFMLMINRGDHVAIMVQPLIIVGFSILAYKIITLSKSDAYGTFMFLAILCILAFCLSRTYADAQSDTEDLDSFYTVLNYANANLTTPHTTIMSMTKFSTRLNTTLVSDILIPCAYEHGDCVYRHFNDRDIFNWNVSYLNMDYVIVKEEGLDFLRQWGQLNNKSMYATANTIMSWQNISVGNVTIFINPMTNLTYGKFGEFRMYYKNDSINTPLKSILQWDRTNISGYSVYENPKRGGNET